MYQISLGYNSQEFGPLLALCGTYANLNPEAVMSCLALTPQEEVLEKLANGEQNPNSAKHERLFRMASRFQQTTPTIDIERGLYFTRSMKETEGEPLVLRWAKALMNVAKNITVYVDDDQLLVGRAGSDAGRYGVLYPELDGDFYGETLKTVAARPTGALRISKENAEIVEKEISSYWRGKTLHEDIVKHLPPECKRLTYNDESGQDSRFIVLESATQRAALNWSPDYKKVLTRGLKWVKEDAQAKLDALDLDDPEAYVEKKPFYEAIILTADAIILWARRHADLAEQKARACADPLRRQELLKIAEHCRHVPENPARTFWEALQSHWFISLFFRMELRYGGVVTNGRFDQYLYPFFRKDKDTGILTDEKALELLDCVWCNIAQFNDITMSPLAEKMTSSYASWETVCIGGQDRQGRDATNELSYLILESRRASPLLHPELSVRLHSNTPERFLNAVSETIKVGQGFPKIFNDQEIINHFVARGAKFEDALDYTNSGCTEMRLNNRDWFTSPVTQYNFPAILEMTLYNGRMLKHGDELLTFESGDPRSFATWEEFYAAFKKQLAYCLRLGFASQHLINKLREKHFATPAADMLHDLSMEYAKDIQSYDPVPGALSIGFIDLFGLGTIIDSLAAIKQRVYEEKSVSWDELLEALRANWAGHEDLRRKMAASHAYGNNDPYADDIGRDLDTFVQEFAIRNEKFLGCEMCLRCVPVTGYVPHGAEVSATPNGRFAWTPLSEGSSASHGADRTGATGVILSNNNIKNKGLAHYAAKLLNIKFTPNLVRGVEGTRNLSSFIRSILDKGIWHVQFNVINGDIMRTAQKEPEKYRNLMVRIAGYSAYFVELSKALQDDLIDRTEHETF